MARPVSPARELRLPELEHQRHLDARAFLGREMGRVRDGAVEQRGGFARGISLQGIAGRHAQILSRPQVVAGAMEVTGQVRRRFVLAPGKHPFQRPAGAAVRVGSRLGRGVLEHDLLVEAVRKAVNRTEDAVGELDDAFANDERPAPRQHLEHRLERELVHVSGVRGQPQGELGADDARRIDGLTLVARQFLELPRDRASQARGNGPGEGLGRHLELPAAAAVHEVSPAHEVIDRRHEKQRIAGRQLMHDRGGLERQLGSQLQVEILRHFVGREWLQPELAGMRPREQVGMRPSQRRRGGGRVRRPDGRQEQELRRIAALAEAVEDVDRGRVRPLNILDPQDERRVFGQGLDRRHDLAQHPGSGGDVRARGEGPRGIVGETGEMRQPARRQSRQRGGDGFVVGGAREAREQVEQGIVRFGGAREPHALRPGRPHRLARRGDAEKRLAERGLADAGVAGHEDDLPMRSRRLVERAEQARHLSFAPDKDRRRRASGEVERGFDDRGDEDVAALDEAADELGADRLVAERPANLADEHLDVVGMDVGPGPHARQERLPGDDVAGALDEHGEHVEGLVGERNPNLIPIEASGGQVQRKRRKIFHVSNQSGQAIVTETGHPSTAGRIRGTKSYRNPTEPTTAGDPTWLLP